MVKFSKFTSNKKILSKAITNFITKLCFFIYLYENKKIKNKKVNTYVHVCRKSNLNHLTFSLNYKKLRRPCVTHKLPNLL